MNHAAAIQQATGVDSFAQACRNFAETLAAAASDEVLVQSAELVELAREIADLARTQQCRGAPELLRLWISGLEARAADGKLPEAETLVFMSSWFATLSACACAQGTRDDVGLLVRSLRDIDWIPAVSDRMQDYLIAQLNALIAPVAMADPGSADTALESSEPGNDSAWHPIAPLPEADGDAITAWPLALMSADPAATDVAAAPDADPDAPIWVGPAELELVKTTLIEQLLPAVQAWDEAAADGDTTERIDAVAYLTGLLANACEVLGLNALGQSASALQLLLDATLRGERACSAADAMQWVAALMLVVEQPGADSAAAVVDAMPAGTIADPAWAEALRVELGRVRVGIDPAVIAARKIEATTEDVDLSMAPDVLPSVLEGMLREVPGHANRFGTLVRGFESALDFAALDEARRIAHTLKGDGNTVGLRGLGNLTHALEDILGELVRDPVALNPALAATLGLAADAIEEISEFVTGRGAAPRGLLAIYQQVLDSANALARREAPSAGRPAPDPSLEPLRADLTPPTAAPPAPMGATVAETPAASGATSLHVPLAQLDELLRLSGETLVLANQIEERLRGVGGAHAELDKQVRGARELVVQLDDLVALRGAALQATRQGGQGDVDPLELDQYNELHVVSRRLIETNTDEGEFVNRIDVQLRQLSDLTVQQERLHTDLQRLVVRTRTVPFSQVVPRLQRIVRQTSRQLGKQVVLDIRGDRTEIDSEILDRLIEPLGHALRNAVDHGIEFPETRIALGKPAEGRIEIDVRVAGDAIEIGVRDDGQGLDLTAIRAKAVRAGLIDAEAVAGDDTIARLILHPGFSTREATTQVSGRGIGMDVVNQRMLALRGSLTLHSQSGRGLSLQLRAPSNQLAANVVLARGANCVLAVTAASVIRVISLVQEPIVVGDDGTLSVEIDGAATPLYAADGFFLRADERLPGGAMRAGLLVEDSRGKRHVMGAHRIDEVRNVVVKPLGRYVASIPAVRGMTILGDGGIAPVLDLVALVDSLTAASKPLMAATELPVERPCVVVADDSLSVRRALTQLMQDAGFEVIAARDGLEALNAINESNPVAVLLDLEMPRLNGLEVARFMRTRESTRDVPIIMITSRTGERYQSGAQQAGVNRLIGKPFDEDELVRAVREQILARPNPGAALEHERAAIADRQLQEVSNP